MMRLRPFFVGATVALFGLVSAGGAEPPVDSVKNELMALVGTWEAKRQISGGIEQSALPGLSLVLTDGKYKMQLGGKDLITAVFTIDMTKSG